MPAWSTIHSDFSNYYVSARLVVEGQDLTKLYNNDWFQDQIKEHGIDEPGKFAPFPPITAWVMVPLTFTDVLTAKRIWTVLNCLLLIASIWLIYRLTNWDWPSSALLVLATGNGLVNNFRFGQLYLLVTVAILLSFYLINKNKSVIASFIFSAIIWIKYFPIVFIIGFFSEKKSSFIRLIFFSFFILTIAQTAFFGKQVMLEYFTSALLPHLDGQLNGQNMYSYLFQSWDSLFRNLFVYSEQFNPHPFINWPMGRWVLKGAVYLLVGLALFVVLQKARYSQLNNSVKSSLYTALSALAVFVLLPAGASYHFILLIIPMMMLLSCELFSRKDKFLLFVNYAIIGFIPYSMFLRVSTNAGLIFAYPRLALVCLLLLATLLITSFRLSSLKKNNTK
jgi:Glycosyltransferase family 87